jgi:hypothetical protein
MVNEYLLTAAFSAGYNFEQSALTLEDPAAERVAIMED